MGSTTDRIKDIGPQPQSFDVEHATKEKTNYRSVVWSGHYLQVTLMSIPVGGDIGLEAHPETDQFLRLDAGSGRVQSAPINTLRSSVLKPIASPATRAMPIAA
jgi:mannose-6-phosphate isomerase-like protein (cupin superfamily)